MQKSSNMLRLGHDCHIAARLQWRDRLACINTRIVKVLPCWRLEHLKSAQHFGTSTTFTFETFAIEREHEK